MHGSNRSAASRFCCQQSHDECIVGFVKTCMDVERHKRLITFPAAQIAKPLGAYQATDTPLRSQSSISWVTSSSGTGSKHRLAHTSVALCLPTTPQEALLHASSREVL